VDRFVIGDECEILVGPGLAAGGDVLAPRADRATVAVLTQPPVATLARQFARTLRGAGLRAEVRVLPDRDAAKRLAVVEEVYAWMNEAGMTRADTVLGVGGGALTDVAGFVAATYLRGVEAVLVPTTLLGAVDAAIGGKTAVNVGGKNLAGVFRHPSRVLIDTEILAALPTGLRREGSAEAVKAGFIADPGLVALYEAAGLDAPLSEVVRRAVAVKVAVVDEDFREQGRRAVLNFGHTLGHAVEVAAEMPHGHAVAVGMVAAARVSTLVAGFADEERVRRVIAALGLPVAAPPGLDPARIRALMLLDKKRDPSGLRMVVLTRIGEATVVRVDDATVGAALGAVGIG
jgi:3-dehydroquinate synthase